MLSVASPGKPIENAISGTGGLDGAQGFDGVALPQGKRCIGVKVIIRSR
jgi:hypothetical protein